MAEYIDRDKLVAKLCERCDLHCDIKTEHCKIVGEIMMQTPADVVEVVRGRWVGLEYDGYADGLPVYDLWECSECGNEVRGEDVPDTHPWCNGCGAKMDGE